MSKKEMSSTKITKWNEVVMQRKVKRKKKVIARTRIKIHREQVNRSE